MMNTQDASTATDGSTKAPPSSPNRVPYILAFCVFILARVLYWLHLEPLELLMVRFNVRVPDFAIGNISLIYLAPAYFIRFVYQGRSYRRWFGWKQMKCPDCELPLSPFPGATMCPRCATPFPYAVKLPAFRVTWTNFLLSLLLAISMFVLMANGGEPLTFVAHHFTGRSRFYRDVMLVSGLLYGWPLILFFANSTLETQHRKRLQRIKEQRCFECNYDMRAHKPGDNCPECGTPVPKQ